MFGNIGACSWLKELHFLVLPVKLGGERLVRFDQRPLLIGSFGDHCLVLCTFLLGPLLRRIGHVDFQPNHASFVHEPGDDRGVVLNVLIIHAPVLAVAEDEMDGHAPAECHWPEHRVEALEPEDLVVDPVGMPLRNALELWPGLPACRRPTRDDNVGEPIFDRLDDLADRPDEVDLLRLVPEQGFDAQAMGDLGAVEEGLAPTWPHALVELGEDLRAEFLEPGLDLVGRGVDGDHDMTSGPGGLDHVAGQAEPQFVGAPVERPGHDYCPHSKLLSERSG
jgi:hypothetical protein